MYQNVQPRLIHRMAVDDLHELYIEECGTPLGIPALFLHGGPGAGISDYHRGLFDPRRYRTILFDQRGAGRSRPLGELRNNTTGHLLLDIERIRERLGIEQWLVMGGSWGSTLALAYAQRHPHRVSGLILRGVFLGRKEDIVWFNERAGGARWIFPERWERYEAHIPKAERGDLVGAYWRRLADPNPTVRLAAARAWNDWDAGCTRLAHDPGACVSASSEAMLASATLQAHYFRHRLFLEPNQLLRGAGCLGGIPGTIIQGRYDIVCPPRIAFELTHHWPLARLRFVLAGHSAMEAETVAALVEETDAWACRLDGTTSLDM